MVRIAQDEHRRFLSDDFVPWVHDLSQGMKPFEAGVKAEQRGRPEIVVLVMRECTLSDVRG